MSDTNLSPVVSRPALAKRLGRYAAVAFAVLALGFVLALFTGRVAEPVPWPGLLALFGGAQMPLGDRVLLFGVLVLLGLPLVRNGSLLVERDQPGGALRKALLMGMSLTLLALAAWQLG